MENLSIEAIISLIGLIIRGGSCETSITVHKEANDE